MSSRRRQSHPNPPPPPEFSRLPTTADITAVDTSGRADTLDNVLDPLEDELQSRVFERTKEIEELQQNLRTAVQALRDLRLRLQIVREVRR